MGTPGNTNLGVVGGLFSTEPQMQNACQFLVNKSTKIPHYWYDSCDSTFSGRWKLFFLQHRNCSTRVWSHIAESCGDDSY